MFDEPFDRAHGRRGHAVAGPAREAECAHRALWYGDSCGRRRARFRSRGAGHRARRPRQGLLRRHRPARSRPGHGRRRLAVGRGDSAVGKRRALLDDIRRYQDTCSCFANTNKPVVAAVHGACLGAGMDLITACDIRLASADATFSVRETRIAMVADVGTLQRLPRVIGDGPARELDLHRPRHRRRARARDRARERGAAGRCRACRRARCALAQEIAANSPLAVQGSKQVLSQARRREVEAELDYVALWNAAFLHSDDLAEAMTAFMQRRRPEFKGR